MIFHVVRLLPECFNLFHLLTVFVLFCFFLRLCGRWFVKLCDLTTVLKSVFNYMTVFYVFTC